MASGESWQLSVLLVLLTESISDLLRGTSVVIILVSLSHSVFISCCLISHHRRAWEPVYAHHKSTYFLLLFILYCRKDVKHKESHLGEKAPTQVFVGAKTKYKQDFKCSLLFSVLETFSNTITISNNTTSHFVGKHLKKCSFLHHQMK